MRRYIAVLPLLVAIAAWTGLAVASTASSPTSSGGLPGSSSHPGAPNPAPTKPRVRSVTISSDPNASMVDEEVLLSGQVRGSRVGGLRVALWRKAPRDRQFHFELATRADSHGIYTIALGPRSVRTNRLWYVSVLGVRSPTLLQRVRGRVTLKPSNTLVAPGDRVVFSGHVAPWHAGDVVDLQQLKLGGWQAIGHQALDRASNFAIGHRFARGQARLRVVMPDDPRNATSFSPPLALDVRDIHRIKHVVLIMQENRAFDSYFGTAPGG